MPAVTLRDGGGGAHGKDGRRCGRSQDGSRRLPRVDATTMPPNPRVLSSNRLLVVSLLSTWACAGPPVGPSSDHGDAPVRASVTLITGDRVELIRDGERQAVV